MESSGGWIDRSTLQASGWGMYGVYFVSNPTAAPTIHSDTLQIRDTVSPTPQRNGEASAKTDGVLFGTMILVTRTYQIMIYPSNYRYNYICLRLIAICSLI